MYLDLDTLGSNFKVSASYSFSAVPEIELLKTDMTIARCNSVDETQVMRLVMNNPDYQIAKLWLGLIHWWKSDYRYAYKMFKSCEGMLDWNGNRDFRPYWYQLILMKDEVGTWDTWFSAINNFRSGASNLLLETSTDSRGEQIKELSHIYELYLHGHNSQAGQDALIEDFFNHNEPRDWTFVDIGAFDGFTMSNTRNLFNKGWGGLCVEPVESSFNKLSHLYKGEESVKCIHSAIGPLGGEDEVEIEIGANLATSRVLYGEKSSDKEYETVIAMNINSLLEEEEVYEFDFLNIDVENLNLEVMLSLDLERYRPKLVVVEYNRNSHHKTKMVNHMDEFGYKLWFDNLQDLFFCLKDSKSNPAFWNTKTLIPERGK